MYDVIVVGAGSTESIAAKVLAEKGLHALLVERHKPPRYRQATQRSKSYMERQWNFVGRMAGTFSGMIV